jgi:hypothetical protein
MGRTGSDHSIESPLRGHAIMRYRFSSPASWFSVNVNVLGLGFEAGVGGVFDGRYVYVASEIASAPVFRFKMK